MIIEGNIVDIAAREIYQGALTIEAGRIVACERRASASSSYIMPGFIDAHLHIESSMLSPSAFSDLVVARGTVAVVADPHEIANVMGCEGVDFMIESSKRGAIRTYFTIPSSVPATPFDLSGGQITLSDVEQMAASGRFVGLSEVMNIFGAIEGDEQILAKIAAAHNAGLVVDGHAPMLRGEQLERYVARGIATDHECTSLAEAQEKIACGMKILIREGSAAKNYAALSPLIASSPQNVMFCTDDSHPDDIISEGHIDKIVRRAVADGFDIFDLLQIASINPIAHYGLDVGDLSVGSRADFIVVDNLRNFGVQELYIGGELQFKAGVPVASSAHPLEPINRFWHEQITRGELARAVSSEILVIGLVADELITTAERYCPSEPTPNLESDIESDILKIVYINRYHNSPPVVEYCRGFGLREGAFASSVAHDSHNIVAVGCSDSELTAAINAVIESKGALAVAWGDRVESLPLPIGGIMSDRCGEQVARQYSQLGGQLRAMGSQLTAPFMTLSFLSLVVIPSLKIGERGLFDYTLFDWCNGVDAPSLIDD